MEVGTQEIQPLNLPELDDLVMNYHEAMGYGPMKGDEKLSVEFEEQGELSTFLSKHEKRPVVRQITVCLISFIDNNQKFNCVSHEVVDGNVHYLTSRFPAAYERFLTRKRARDSGDINAYEIPLSTLALTPVEETTLRMYGITSVQQLAKEDPATTRLVVKGSDLKELIERAKRILEAIEGPKKKGNK